MHLTTDRINYIVENIDNEGKILIYIQISYIIYSLCFIHHVPIDILVIFLVEQFSL